jgi:amphi-Trp domain-containing protein
MASRVKAGDLVTRLTRFMKRRKIRYADQRNVPSCIEQLQAIVDGLKAGTVSMVDNGQAMFLRPGGAVEFELRVDQLERRETLRIELTWQPQPRREGEPVEPQQVDAGSGPILRPAAEPHGTEEPSLEREEPVSVRTRDRVASDEYQRLYAAARVLGNDGQWHIDQDQLIQSLARAGVDPLTQQELYSLALQADADGRARMLSERVIEALEQANRREPRADISS